MTRETPLHCTQIFASDKEPLQHKAAVTPDPAFLHPLGVRNDSILLKDCTSQLPLQTKEVISAP